MTGAEALQQIINSVEALTNTMNELKTSVHMIEANIKVLNNRAAGLMKAQSQEPSSISIPSMNVSNVLSAGPGPAFSAGPPSQKTQQLQATPAAATPSRGRPMVEAPAEQRDEAKNFIRELSENNDNSSNVLSYKKIFGKLVNNDNEPIENVLIKIYDRNNEVCASTETDPIGYWETMLKPGRYVAEYVKSGFKTTNKTFEVGKNSKEVEVK